MREAETNLSRLVKAIATGAESEIIIANGKTPVARIVPFEESQKRPLGIDEGLFVVPEDFDAPDPETIALFESG
jgi:antitoxin (DNA-binding transcriptional repressor) of toxin-antitoxin stability system